MRKLKKITALVLSGAIAVSLAGCGATQAQNSAVQEIFTDDKKISYSLDYKELKEKAQPYLDALEIAAERVRAFLSAILARGKETREHKAPARKHGRDMEI